MAVIDIIGAAGGLASTFLNNAWAQDNAEVAFNRNKEMMALQQRYSRENWTYEQAYNSPIRQMERLKAAGINPNLIYGNGSAGLVAGPHAAPGVGSAPMAETFPLSNPVMDAVSAAQGLAAAKKAGSEAVGQDIENKYLLKTFNDRVTKVALDNNWTKQQTATLEQQFVKYVADFNLAQKEIELKQISIDKLGKKFDAEISKLNSEKKISDEELRQMKEKFPYVLSQLQSESGLAGLELEVQSDFRRTNESLGIIGKVIQFICRLVRAAK